ncbi:unnamed protein product, partial [Nesidiocoris tenuis]
AYSASIRDHPVVVEESTCLEHYDRLNSSCRNVSVVSEREAVHVHDPLRSFLRPFSQHIDFSCSGFITRWTLHVKWLPPEDDVFLKPAPLWEDIASSIQKLDPENAEMLASVTQVKIEFPDDQVLHPLIKCEKGQTGTNQTVNLGGCPRPPFDSGGLPWRTPPPPYPLQLRPHGKYNRRNNPELEKRRIHHCTFNGTLKNFENEKNSCSKVYTKSSHLKAHQRIHTVALVLTEKSQLSAREKEAQFLASGLLLFYFTIITFSGYCVKK